MTRPHCPVCESGPELRVVNPAGPRAALLRCDRCSGLLAHVETVAVAAAYYHASHYVMSVGHGRHHCRHCQVLFDSKRSRCRVCMKEQAICCQRCFMSMELVDVAGVLLDVCRSCRVVWFDRGELGRLSRKHPEALLRSIAGRQRARHAVELGQAALDLSDAIPATLQVARGAADVAARVVEGVADGGAVEVVVSAGEGAIELGAIAIEAVLGIFDVF